MSSEQPHKSNAEKIEEAKEWLGTRWIGHPSNRVRKLAEPLPEVFTWKPTTLLKGWVRRV